MGFDPAYANSSGYFRDPGTGEELSSDMPRSVEAALVDGKLIWPRVRVSTGEDVKIVFKYFTPEEKALYNEYRGRGSSEPKAPRQSKSKGTPQLDPNTGEIVYVQDESEAEEPKQPVKQFDPEAAEVEYAEQADPVSTPATQELIASCDHILGCSRIAGITYALLTKDKQPNKIYHVPRSLIKEEDMRRLS
jgi:hypothetical protein